jgi:hypothetical protein
MSYRICFYEACKRWNHQVKTIGLLDWGESLEILTLSSVWAYLIEGKAWRFWLCRRSGPTWLRGKLGDSDFVVGLRLLDWGESLEILTLTSVSAYAIDEGSISSIDYWAGFESQEVGGNLIGEARGNGWSGISGMVSNMVSMCLMPSH